ncbi:hypothetical protein [Bacillus sp. BS98]|uniref:hypothetical protein n=1 Tax=Bacillus sp. BS98 TaxID=2608254 RepID=UPI00122ED018|nr:hypothetical protein [Bacillus sp. BS98]QEQ20796.1 hypothetical protein F0362_30125 [Bacillus sp. BS98]
MNRLVCIGISIVLLIGLGVSLSFNYSQSQKNNALEEKIKVLSEQDVATAIATEFVNLSFQGEISKENQRRIREITTSKLQDVLFEKNDNHEHLEDEEISETPKIDQTFFNRISDKKANVNFKVTLLFKGKDVQTATKIDVNTELIKEKNKWKVDVSKISYQGQQNTDPQQDPHKPQPEPQVNEQNSQ